MIGRRQRGCWQTPCIAWK